MPALPTDRAIEAPPDGASALDWWAGIYDVVYVGLNPFVRLPPNVATSPGYEPGRPRSERPVGFEDTVKRSGVPVRWSDVHRAAVPDEEWQTVRFAIQQWSALGLYEPTTMPIQRRIDAFCKAADLRAPFTDALPAILEPAIGTFLTALGARSVIAFDEFRWARAEIAVPAFAADKPHVALPRSTIRALHLADPGVLMAWQFDAAYFLVAMTARALDRARPEASFEGWFADRRPVNFGHAIGQPGG